MQYKDAGVDIDKANEAVSRIKKYVKDTYTSNVLSNVGTFGGLYQLGENVLVSSTDGVGTKLRLAFMTGKHDSVGQDLVNHCVNDILVMGAKPLFFLDYIGCGKLNPGVIEDIVKGLSVSCKENNCVLISGEVAELPGFYKENEYDLASFVVGLVKRDKIIDGSKIKKGDAVIGLASNGLHTNGYSLALKVLLEKAELGLEDRPGELGCSLKEELMKVHRSYFVPVSSLFERFEIKGIVHITGGGLLENIPRIMPEGLGVQIEKKSINILPIFPLIQKLGDVPEEDMFRTFNMGVGMVLVVDKDESKEIINILNNEFNLNSNVIGEIIEGEGIKIV